MLTQLGSKNSNFLPSIASSDQKSPYLMQYKVFEDRLKRQEKGIFLHHGRKNKKAKSYLHQDYTQLTNNILNKKQILNLLQDIPCETEPCLSAVSEELAMKTRMLFENKIGSKKQGNKHLKEDTLSEYKQNVNSQKSRIKSQCNTQVIKHQKDQNNAISFIGYKKNKKPIIEMGFKKVLGFI